MTLVLIRFCRLSLASNPDGGRPEFCLTLFQVCAHSSPMKITCSSVEKRRSTSCYDDSVPAAFWPSSALPEVASHRWFDQDSFRPSIADSWSVLALAGGWQRCVQEKTPLITWPLPSTRPKCSGPRGNYRPRTVSCWKQRSDGAREASSRRSARRGFRAKITFWSWPTNSRSYSASGAAVRPRTPGTKR